MSSFPDRALRALPAARNFSFSMILGLSAAVGVPTTTAAQAPALAFERTIGCAMCDDARLLGSVQSVAIDEFGRVIATDASEPKVRVFRGDGSLVVAFGRDGRGPAELGLPAAGVATREGDIIIVDMGQRRISRFDSIGNHLTVRSVNLFPVAAGIAPKANAILMTTTDFVSGLTLLRVDGNRQDTILARVPYAGDSSVRFIRPAVRPDGGFAFGDGQAAYRIDVFGPSGNLERTLTRDVPRRERTRLELKRAAETRGFSGSGATRPATVRRDIDPLQPHFVNLSALQFDDEGRLWVRTARGREGTTVFDVFGADGAFVGDVEVAREIGTYAVGGGKLVGVVTDENDIQYLAVWSVR